MATKDITDALVKLLDECTLVGVEDIIRNPDWGKITFEACKPELERTYSMMNHLKILPVELLPDAQANSIIQPLTQLKSTLDSIKKFSIEGGNPTGTRDQLISTLQAQSDQFYTAAHLYIPYLAYQKGDIQRNIADLTKSVSQASSLLDDTKKEIVNKQKEIGEIIIAARDAASSVGVAHFSADFMSESTAQESSATTWLKATGLAAGVTLVAAIASIFIPISSDATTPQVFQLFTSKVVILGLLFTSTIWCGRLYKGAKHQGLVNKHRSNALRTFQAFTKAASDDSVRDAVLLEATKSIFALTPSGYLDNESSPESGAKVIEVIRNVSQAAAAAK